ncbi:hypothetical protein [Thermobispora bispora]|uniref:hypothetical protein n=1 Tax=Thermobispora bispora TaxID=2006 RepID=UPI00197ED920|nr:hypothetical protein [Thermobispora bispora]
MAKNERFGGRPPKRDGIEVRATTVFATVPAWATPSYNQQALQPRLLCFRFTIINIDNRRSNRSP